MSVLNPLTVLKSFLIFLFSQSKLKQTMNSISGEILRVYSWTHEETYKVPKKLEKVCVFGFGEKEEARLSDKRILCLTLTMCSSLVGLSFKVVINQN
jgi:hypothetical protein